MDAPAGRSRTRSLRRACPAPAVRGVITGANGHPVGSRSRVYCAGDPTRLAILAIEGGVLGDDRRGRHRAGLPRGKPTRAIEAFRGGCSGDAHCVRRASNHWPERELHHGTQRTLTRCAIGAVGYEHITPPLPRDAARKPESITAFDP